MARIMYDADNPYDIPSDAAMVAGYIDGSRTTWTQAMWDRFPNAQKITISAVGKRWDADVFDVEPGCIWPPENVIPLVKKAREEGRWPTVYCNEVNHWQYIRDMFRGMSMEEPPYLVANYDGDPTIPHGAVGKQFAHPRDVNRPANRPQQPWETFKHFDLSSIANHWPGVDGDDEMTPEQSKQLARDIADEINVRVLWGQRYGDAQRNLVDMADERTNRLIRMDDRSPALVNALEVTNERLGQVVNLLIAIREGDAPPPYLAVDTMRTPEPPAPGG